MNGQAIRRGGLWALLASFGALLVSQGGCNRTWYRQDADREAYELIQEKSDDPRWTTPEFSIYMDPRSRYYDPADPDRSSIPPDDPASHRYMHEVYGMKGYEDWHQYGDRTEIENPQWHEHLDEYLQKTEDGRYLLTLPDAVVLAYLHSPDYQEQLEELYLSALDVAFERFRFDVQFFGGNDTTFTHAGQLFTSPLARLAGAPVPSTASEANTLSTTSDLVANKLFPTGAELLMGFANSFVWQFAGPDTNQTASVLNFSLLQPLLRLGGRDVVLERLTRVERGLLANLRALARWRKMFYIEIVMGDEAFGGPQRGGGFFGGAGLTGFAGTGVGGFGEVGGATQFGRFGAGMEGGGVAAGGGFVGGAAQLANGFVGLVQRFQQLRNQEANLQSVLRELARMEANFEAGRIDAFQVDQFRASVQTQLANLLIARNSFQAGVDAYLRRTLGLPPDLPVAIDDSYVRQFQFIDLRLTQLDQQVAQLATRLRQLTKPTVDEMEQALEEAERFQQALSKHLEVVEDDFRSLLARLDERLRLLDTAEERENTRLEIQQIEQDYRQLRADILENVKNLQQLDNLLTPQNVDQSAQALMDYMDSFSDHVTEVSLVQARVRAESVVITPIEITEEEAFAVAREHRLDWMNQQAALVDQWRLIAFNADRLESDLNVIFSGDLSTKRDNPLDFRGKTGSLTVGLEFDAPLTREAERNQYREAIINYQAARRQYIQFVDSVKETLRQQLRDLEQARQNLELQRRSFAITLRQFDIARLRLREPPPPAVAGEVAVAQFGPTLARDLLGALTDLLTAQNNVMGVWIQYERTRMQLFRDLGVMQVDDNGMWVEEPLAPYIEEARLRLAEEPELLPVTEPGQGADRPQPEVDGPHLYPDSRSDSGANQESEKRPASTAVRTVGQEGDHQPPKVVSGSLAATPTDPPASPRSGETSLSDVAELSKSGGQEAPRGSRMKSKWRPLGWRSRLTAITNDRETAP